MHRDVKKRWVPWLMVLGVLIFGREAVGQCVPGPETLCLQGYRIRVELDWTDPAGPTGAGRAVGLSENTGWFFFEEWRYLDVLVKVLDGCALNGYFWVYTTELSDFAQALTVTDTSTGQTAVYNAPSEASSVITDTTALPCSSSRASQPLAPPSSAFQSALSLVGGRFTVEVDWEDFVGATGSGSPLSLTTHSGLFWLFDPSNFEIAVKMVDGGDGYFWVALGALTDVELTVTVTDTCESTVKIYSKPLGIIALPFIDKTAFPATQACPTLIFSDGFEVGDTTAWSSSTS